MPAKPTRDPQAIATELFKALKDQSPGRVWYFSEIQKLKATQQLLSSDPAVQARFAHLTLSHIGKLATKMARSLDDLSFMLNLAHDRNFPCEAALVVEKLLRRKLPLSSEDVTALINWTADTFMPYAANLKYVSALVGYVARFARENQVTDQLGLAIDRLAEALGRIDRADERKLVARLTSLRSQPLDIPLHPSDSRASPVSSTTPDSQRAALKLLHALNKIPRPKEDYPRKLTEVAECKAALEAGPSTQVAFIREVIDRVVKVRERLSPAEDHRALWLWNVKGFPHWGSEVMEHLFKRKLPFHDQDYVWIVSRLADLGILALFAYPYLKRLIEDLETHIQQAGLSPELSRALARMADCFISNAAEQKMAARLRALRQESRQLHLQFGEAWANQAITDLEAMERQGAGWLKLLSHCQSAVGSQPSAKWTATAASILQRIGHKSFRKRVFVWFPLIEQPRTERPAADWRWEHHWEWHISEQSSNVLKGLVWCCGLQEDPATARALADLAVSSYRKIPGIGPRLVKVGNACVWALGNMPGMEGVAQLAILRARVKFGTAQQCIEKALFTTAQRVGLPREELDEMAVPSYGLTEVGLRREALGDFCAELAVAGSSAELRWFRADGKPQACAPAAVRKHFADHLKELQQAAKDIRKMLSAQTARLDQLHLCRKSWPLGAWRERYLDHPLVGRLARRLIWRFVRGGRSGDGIFVEDRFVDAEDQTLNWLDAQARVELWHPIGHRPDEVFAWRRWLEEHHVQQPFKQAHREIYLLTDAERQTRIYSNRYAAHILRQHQFNALCATRGWRNKLRLMVDAQFPPATLLLPQWNLRAEFWIEGAGDEYGTDTNEIGTYLYLTTDQVRFYPLEAPQASAHAYGGGHTGPRREQPADLVPLEEVPPLVLSEVLRDVDLFVGVASVGNDPSWVDGGPHGTYRDYWHGYAFGELTATSQTRRQVLEGLIPRLNIADRCSFMDRFLVVRGDLRTYKIHLGSGNILMEPNDQYLCIVRAPSQEGEKVFLPFEGDGMLAIILSKAFLLADDAQITDPTIVSQIRR